MLTHLGYRIAVALALVLPGPLAEGLATLVARVAFACRVPARSVLEANLERLLPGTGAGRRRRLARGAFESFARSLAGFLRGPAGRAGVRVAGQRHLEAALESGRGVIVLSAHLGDWEEGAAELAARGCPLHLAARPQSHPRVAALFSDRRSIAGVRALPPGALLAPASRVLRRGGWVALMADRGAAFGGASVCAWAAALARRTGALVLPAVCVHEPGGGHRLIVEAPLEPAACRDGAFRRTLDRWLARWPDQWAAFEPVPEGLA